MYVIGITRFSLVTNHTLSSFVSTRGMRLCDAQAKILAKERLDRRLSLFCGFCLPTYQLLNRELPQFMGIVLVSDALPKHYLGVLRQLASRTKAFHVLTVKADERLGTVVRSFLAERIGTATIYSLRLDDDDALSAHYVEALKSIIRDLKDGQVISMTRGAVVERISQNQFRYYRKSFLSNSYGLARVSRAPLYLNAYSLGNHTKITAKYQVQVVTGGKPKWLAVRHADNDSKSRDHAIQTMTLHQVHREIAKDFPHITIQALSCIAIPLRPDNAMFAALVKPITVSSPVRVTNVLIGDDHGAPLVPEFPQIAKVKASKEHGPHFTWLRRLFRL